MGDPADPLAQLTALYMVAEALLAEGGLGILNERAALYSEVATEVVDTDHTTPAEVVEMIMNAHVAHR